jgi:opacity protein-like surface antigen
MKRIVLAMLILIAAMPLAMAASVTPSQDCSFSGPVDAENWVKSNYDFAYKFDNWDKLENWEYNAIDDVYVRSATVNGNTITIMAYMDEEDNELKVFAWKSTSPLGIVMTKAGPDCYLKYVYTDTTEDTGLVAPEEKGVSFAIFGWNDDGDGGTGGDDDPVPIPEFPTVALPIAAILGLAFFFQRRKE